MSLRDDQRCARGLRYAREAYGRILELDPCTADRRRLPADLLTGPMPGGDRVDEEYRSVVTEAVGAPDGWKRLLRRCALRPSSRVT